MNGACEVDDGADPVGRIVSELIDQFRSVGRPLRFYDVEQKLLDWAEKLRLPSKKLEKEKGLLRERLERLGLDKCALEVELRTMRDCMELSGVFLQLGWSGGVDAAERSAEEIYEAMLSKLMSGNGEDLSGVVDHLRRKIESLECENAKLKMKGDRGSWEIGELRRKVNELEVENVELRRKGQEGSGDVWQMRKMEELEKENTMLRRKVDGVSSDAMELRKLKDYEESEKRVIILEKDVIELKSCDAGIVKCKDGREGHSADEEFASGSKNGNTCYAENGVGNGKHSEVIGMVLSVENRINDGVHSAALPTGDSLPISGRVVELMGSDGDTALAGRPAKNKHSQNTWDKEHSPSSTRELKWKSNTFIDLTENDDDSKNGDDFCRSSSWTTNKKRSYQGIPAPFQNPTEQARRYSHHR